MKKIGILLIVIVLGFACLTSPVKKYYQIFLPTNQEVSSAQIDKTIYIDRIPTQSFYDNFVDCLQGLAPINSTTTPIIFGLKNQALSSEIRSTSILRKTGYSPKQS